CRIVCRSGARSGDSTDHVNTLRDVAAGDGRRYSCVGLGVVVENLEIFTLDDTFFFETGQKTFPAVVQGRMFRKLGDADFVRASVGATRGTCGISSSAPCQS